MARFKRSLGEDIADVKFDSMFLNITFNVCLTNGTINANVFCEWFP